MTTPTRRFTDSAADVAKRYGISVFTVRRMVHERGMPAQRVGHVFRFDPDEVDAWFRLNDAPDSTAVLPDEPSPDWVAATLAKFSPDDLRRAAEILRSLAESDSAHQVTANR